MRVFVSYADRARDTADKVASLCREYGHEPFVAYRDMTPRDGRWLPELFRQVDVAQAFVLCLSAESLRAQYQKFESEYAVELHKPIVILHAGEWLPEYLAPDAFPWSFRYQRYRLEHDPDCRAAMAALHPPHEERFAFMRNVVVEAGTQLMLKAGLRFLSGIPQAIDARKNYSTEIDLAVQDYIVSRIRAQYPGEVILAEERGPLHAAGQPDTEFIWTVDGLDGTLNFISGDDKFCCGIGLLRRGKPLLGACFTPSRMELFSGGEGRGAERRVLLDGTAETLKANSKIVELADCHTLTHVNSEDEIIEACYAGDFPKSLHHEVRRVWMWGCGLLAIMAVGRGSHHLFIQRCTYPWDLAPALAILRAAGGVDSVWPAKKPKPWTRDPGFSGPSRGLPSGIVVASNPRLLGRFFDRFSTSATPG